MKMYNSSNSDAGGRRSQDDSSSFTGPTADRATDGRFAAPAISLPSGGGAIKSIGEKFSVNPANGTGRLTIPLPLSPGRSGFTPALSLGYDSGFGNGPYGLGWSVNYPAITRRTDRGIPRYRDSEESDVFLLSGAEDLVPVIRSDGTRDQVRRDGYLVARYRPRIEGLFARIERWTNLTDPSDVFWRTISRDNVTNWLGKTLASRIADPGDPRKIFTWLTCQSSDDKGNAAVYEYIAEDSRGVDIGLPSEANRSTASRTANRYLKRVKYGNATSLLTLPDLSVMDWLFELVMDYGDHAGDAPVVAPDRAWPVRPDPLSLFRAGFEVRTYRRCQRILMFHRFAELGSQPRLVRSLELDYDDLTYSPGTGVAAELGWQGSTRVCSLLRRATSSGYADSGVRKSWPAVELTYAHARIDDRVQTLAQPGDRNLPAGVDDVEYRWVDLNREGISGVLSQQGGSWWYKRNLGDGELGPAQRLARQPSLGLDGRIQLLDLDGSGSLDLVELNRPVAGFFTHGDQGEWSPFTPFASQPNIAWDDPNLRMVDLTGDGLADILITRDDVLCWHGSLGEQGFGPENTAHLPHDEASGARVVFQDGTETIFLADMSGDGLADLVRVRASQICYWPNLGYGRFGARVVMDGAPVLDSPERFDPRRVRLADIDGSGTTDLIYCGSDGVRLYFNRSGNAWTAGYRLTASLGTDPAASVQVTDLLGKGTACLVWSSPLPGNARAPLRFVDLVSGEKPYLLVGFENNLGARSAVTYTSSTKFYLQDQRAGRPWVTRLPFPVQVVERVDTYDDISQNHFVTGYTYHHGYFDGVEREFRGFGMVEQIDTEELAALTADPASAPAMNLDSASHVPPVLTRTWFHTGVYLGRDRVSRFYAGLLDDGDPGEYYREPGLSDAQAAQLLLDDTVLPPGLTTDEEREACRALRGAMLRQEIYALDGTDRQPHPYSVTEQNFTLRMLQAKGRNPHAVFLSQQRESLTYHYEREPTDPRTAHTLTLNSDDFGNPLNTASVVYGRRQVDPALEARDQAQQAAIHVVYSDALYSNAVDASDAYRAPMTCESRTYELTGLAVATGAVRFSLDQLLVAGQAAAEIAYEQTPGTGGVQKRLVQDTRTLYRSDDLVSSLPLGQVEALALPFEVYQLAFTPGLIDAAYATRVTGDKLTAGGYVQFDGDPRWWIPTGRVFYSPGDGDDAATELATAHQHFFLPRRFRDPFAQTTSAAQDGYDLLVVQTRDPVGNLVTVGERDGAGNVIAGGHDYRVLQPRLVTDPNGNRKAASFDALGLIAGTAVMGKRDETPRRGDVLDGFEPDLSDDVVAAHLSDPLADPLAILGRATTRLVYDLFGFQRTKQQAQPAPTLVYALGRETHDADLAAGEQPRTQHSLSYSDGFGREIQKKVQAEPGPVPRRDPATGRIVVVEGRPVMTDGDVAPRWVGSGWTVYDNKGNPVRQFEPFFTDTHQFEFDVRIGVSPIVCYDPIRRVVATVHPDHSWEKLSVRAWRQERWDVNDTALIADPKLDPDVGDHFRRLREADYLPTWYAQRQDGALGVDAENAAAATAAHAATPSVSHGDSLGRPFLTIAHNRFTPSDAAPGTPPTDEFYATRIAFDIQGNQREVSDTADRIVIRSDHDVLGNRIHQISMDAGERWVLNDVTGRSIHSHDSRGHHVRIEYDALRRPVRSFVQGVLTDPAAEILFARTEYGEDQPQDAQLNLRARLFRQYDGAGVVTNAAFDFKGNLLETSRQLTSDDTAIADWSANPALEPETFASSSVYDALDRPTVVTTPDASRYRPRYNEASLLDGVNVDVRGSGPTIPLVTEIHHDAKGQRIRITYGNDTRTEYTYDPWTFRLVELVTTRTTDQGVVQDLTYTYDAVGNVTQIRDAALETIYFNNQVVTPDSQYTYDAAYRLIHAEGREHVGQALQPQTTWDDAFRVQLPQPGDGQAMRRYREDYRYDGVGNLLALVHQAAGGDWTRSYSYAEASAFEPGRFSNRLTSTTVGTDGAETCTYDAHGNIASQAHLTLVRWDFRDQLSATSRQAVNDGTPETTYYVYDVAGRRTRKVTRRQNGTRKNERIYLNGFEVYREYGGDGTTVSMARETLHVMDDSQRIALVENQTIVAGVPQPALVPVTRYQYGNHLGSAALELDGGGAVVSYEEYYPYGSTSYQAMSGAAEVSLKRYRYTAMERDNETGFNYHAARYYLPWLGRWLSPDPGGVSGGLNLYGYCLSNPINAVDVNGREPASVSIGHAGDPDLPSPATAKRADLVRYAAHHGFDYTGPDPTPDQYRMTDQGGQWVVESRYLKPHTYNPGDEYRGGFGMQPGDGVDVGGTIPTGPYQTSSNSSSKPNAERAGGSAGQRHTGGTAGAKTAAPSPRRPPRATAAPGEGDGKGTAAHASAGNPNGFLPAWVGTALEVALIAVAVVAAVATIAVFATAFVGALAVEGTSITTAATLAAGDTIVGTGAVAGGAGGAAAIEKATEGEEVAAVAEGTAANEQDVFYRFGKDWESPTRLGRQAAEAERSEIGVLKIKNLHGVSVTPTLTEQVERGDAGSATRGDIGSAGFNLVFSPTRNDPNHHTLILPKPVTPQIAKLFNELFGRTKK